MSRNCEYFRLEDGRWQCRRCGDVARAYARSPLRQCTKRGLGDYVAAVLMWFGLNRDRYQKMRGRRRVVGGMHCYLADVDQLTCGCEDRQQLLNELGERIGL